jgi:hypothetical protein
MHEELLLSLINSNVNGHDDYGHDHDHDLDLWFIDYP